MPSLIAALALGTGVLQSTAPWAPPVSVRMDFTADTFPASWRTEEIRASGESLAAEERERSAAVLRRAFAKYPPGVLERSLQSVYVLRRITFYGLDYGGTNSNDTVYLANDGTANGYSDAFLEGAFHHEFSSIVLRNNMPKLDIAAWKAANPAGFTYGAGGTAALQAGRASTEMTDAMLEQGFVSQYSQASLEEDFNMVAECLFMGRKQFWAGAAKYPSIAAKARLAIELYGSLDPWFDEERFRSFAR
jgi:hypothetical protein